MVAATDYIRMFADQIRAFVPARYAVLGTDGFGRSDTRWNLRRHFEVDRVAIAYTILVPLVQRVNYPLKLQKKWRKNIRLISMCRIRWEFDIF